MNDQALDIETNRYLDRLFDHADELARAEDVFITDSIDTQFESADNLAAAVDRGLDCGKFDALIAEIAYHDAAGHPGSLFQAVKRLQLAVRDQARVLAQEEWQAM